MCPETAWTAEPPFSDRPGLRIHRQRFMRCDPETIDSIEGGRFVAFGERGVIEYRIHEVLDRPTEGQHRLTDVYQLTGALADDVHAQQRVRVQVEDQLQQTAGVTADLAARNLPILRLADLVGNPGFGQVVFGRPTIETSGIE